MQRAGFADASHRDCPRAEAEECEVECPLETGWNVEGDEVALLDTCMAEALGDRDRRGLKLGESERSSWGQECRGVRSLGGVPGEVGDGGEHESEFTCATRHFWRGNVAEPWQCVVQICSNLLRALIEGDFEELPQPVVLSDTARSGGWRSGDEGRHECAKCTQ